MLTWLTDFVQALDSAPVLRLVAVKHDVHAVFARLRPSCTRQSRMGALLSKRATSTQRCAATRITLTLVGAAAVHVGRVNRCWPNSPVPRLVLLLPVTLPGNFCVGLSWKMLPSATTLRPTSASPGCSTRLLRRAGRPMAVTHSCRESGQGTLLSAFEHGLGVQPDLLVDEARGARRQPEPARLGPRRECVGETSWSSSSLRRLLQDLVLSCRGQLITTIFCKCSNTVYKIILLCCCHTLRGLKSSAASSTAFQSVTLSARLRQSLPNACPF